MNGKSYTKNVSVTVNQFKTAKDYVAANVEVTYPDGKKYGFQKDLRLQMIQLQQYKVE